MTLAPGKTFKSNHYFKNLANMSEKSWFLFLLKELDPRITFITFISVHPRVTSVWTGSVHVMTRFPVATVTTQFFTLHTVCVIAAFCKGSKR